MDLSKFLNFIQSSTLYFARSDLLGDPFEGSSSQPTKDIFRDQLTKEGIDPARIDKILANLSQITKSSVQETFVSCWHASEYESAGMWRLYSQSSEAVAIQTTFDKLANELPSCAYMGVVQYIDYSTDVISHSNIFNALMRKRKSFEHEREVRSIIWAGIDQLNNGKSDDDRVSVGELGVEVSVNLPNFIESIYVSPSAPAWFLNVVRDVTDRYALQTEVHQSSLSSSPIY